MTIGNSWKKIIAGTLAVLVVAGAGTANVSLDKLLGNNVIVASAEAAYSLYAFGGNTIGKGVSINGHEVIDPDDYDADYVTVKTESGDILADKAVEWTADKDYIITDKQHNDLSSQYEAQYGDAFVHEYVFTVKEAPVPVAGVQFDKTELTMDYGDTAEISYTFLPENATNKHFVIEVADNDILDWDFAGTNGIELTGKKAGTTTVKVTADNWNEDPSDDVSAVCTVTVNKIASSCKVGVIGTQPYTGEPLQLVESAEAEGGELVYAIGDEKGASEPYTAILPKATEAGDYYVWYKVIGDENHLDSLEVGEKSVIEAPVSEKIDLSEGTVTVDTENKTVSAEVDGETVPESEYHVIYFTYEELEGGETVTRVGTEYPTEPGTYIAAVVANEDSELYTGENRSQPFTIEAAAEDSSESAPDSKSDTSKADTSKAEESKADTSKADTSKSDTSKAADSSSKAAAAATTSNPATGAAAAGISAAALAAAALVVAKRKKD